MYRAALFEFQEKEIKRIQRLVSEGLDIRKLLGAKSDELFGFRRQLRNRMLEIMTRASHFGGGQVADELKRQTDDRAGGVLQATQGKPGEPDGARRG